MSTTRDEESRPYGRMIVALECIEGCAEFASLIPEVRTNLVYAKLNPRGPEDVLAVDGRITVVNGMPRAAGRPKYGASSHMARLIVELNKYDSSIRAGVNFAGDPPVTKWLEGYCRSKGWTFGVIDRADEPEEVKDKEGASMSWKASEAMRAAGGTVPKLFYESGAAA